MRHAVRFSCIEGLFSQFQENMSAKCDLVAKKVQTNLTIGYRVFKSNSVRAHRVCSVAHGHEGLPLGDRLLRESDLGGADTNNATVHHVVACELKYGCTGIGLSWQHLQSNAVEGTK